MSKKDREIISFDYAIKYLFRDKKNFVILEGFLYALLKEKILIEGILESEGNKDRKELKEVRVDIVARTKTGDLILIEVQYLPEEDFLKRLLFGASRNIVDNIYAGEECKNVKKVYVVSLIYFDFYNTSLDGTLIKDYVTHGKTIFNGIHSQVGIGLDNHLYVGYSNYKFEEKNIFPEYYIVSLSLFNNVVKDDLDQWIFSIKNNCVKDNFKAIGIKEMKKGLDYLAMSPEERQRYNKFLEENASLKGAILFAEKKGWTEGREEGLACVVKSMHSFGDSLECISQRTNLTIKEIENIIKDI